jgi:hypothetical protein
MDGIDRHGASAIERAKLRDNNIPGRRERDRRIERLGRRLVIPAGPDRTELACPSTFRLRSRADEHGAAPINGDLDRTPCRRAESVEPEPAARLDAANPEGAIADDASAEQGRRGNVVDLVRQPHRDVSSGARELGKAAISIPAGEGRQCTQVLAAFAAEPADAACPGEPRDSRPVSGHPALDLRARGLDAPDDLMPEDDRQPSRREIALGELQVGSTHAARRDTQEQLAGSGLGHRKLTQDEWIARDRARPIEDEGAHGAHDPGTKGVSSASAEVTRPRQYTKRPPGRSHPTSALVGMRMPPSSR